MQVACVACLFVWHWCCGVCACLVWNAACRGKCVVWFVWDSRFSVRCSVLSFRCNDGVVSSIGNPDFESRIEDRNQVNSLKKVTRFVCLIDRKSVV